MEPDRGLEHGEVRPGDRHRRRRTPRPDRAGCRGRGSCPASTRVVGSAASQARVGSSIRPRVHSIAALASGLNQSISGPAERGEVVVAGDADRADRRRAARRRRPGPGRSRRRRRGARPRRRSRSRRGPRRGRRGWHGCPRGPRRAPGQPSAASRGRTRRAARRHHGWRRRRRGIARPDGGDRSAAALDDDEAMVGELGERRHPPATGDVHARSARRGRSRGAHDAPRRSRLRARPDRVEVAALPGDEDSARLEERAAPARRARPATPTARAVTAGQRPRSARVGGERLGAGRLGRHVLAQPDGRDRPWRGSGPSCRPNRRAAPGRPAGPPRAGCPESRRRCRGRRTGRSAARPQEPDGASGCRRRGGSAIAAGSRIAVRLIAAFQARRSRTWPSIAARAPAASVSPRRGAGPRRGRRRYAGRQGWAGIDARRERVPRTVQAPLLSVVPVRAVRAPLPASSFVTPPSAPRSSVARPVRGRVSPCPSRASLPKVGSVRMPDTRWHRRTESTRLSTNPTDGPRGCGQLALDGDRRSRRARSRAGSQAGVGVSRGASAGPGRAGRRFGVADRGRRHRAAEPPREPGRRSRRRTARSSRPASSAREGPRERRGHGRRLDVGRTRQDEDERRAAARHRRDVEIAVHPAREVAGDRQAEARCR